MDRWNNTNGTIKLSARDIEISIDRGYGDITVVSVFRRDGEKLNFINSVVVPHLDKSDEV